MTNSAATMMQNNTQNITKSPADGALSKEAMTETAMWDALRHRLLLEEQGKSWAPWALKDPQVSQESPLTDNNNEEEYAKAMSTRAA